MKKTVLILAMAIASLTFVMCSENKGIPVESNWTVETIYTDGTPMEVPADHNATLAFLSGSKIAGDTGCNRFFGEFSIKETNLEFKNMGSTRMMCPEMQFENSYLQTLANTASFKINGEELALMDKSGSVIAILKKIEPVAIEN